MRRALIVAWSPAVVLAACLLASALAGVVGYRALVRIADEQLALTGRYVAHHFESVFASRLSALAGVAAMDAQTGDRAERTRQRRAMIGSLVRLHPEFSWVGFAERPGRVDVAYRDLLAGVDVSDRDWWRAALNGPYLGGTGPAVLRAPQRAGGAVPAAAARSDGSDGPATLLELAVPMRGPAGEPYGVLAAHVDARWVIAVRDEMTQVAGSPSDVDVLVLQREGIPVSGRRLELDPSAAAGDAIRAGTLDGLPRTFSVHPIEGDVVVSRLGWRVAVARDPQVHRAPARRFLAWSIAGGAFVGAVAAAAVALAGAAAGRRAP